MSRQNSRRSVQFSDRLNGRLATFELAGTTNGDVSKAVVAESLGADLAQMVEMGDDRAIKLAGLLTDREHYRRSQADPVLMETVERPIAKLKKSLGFEVDPLGVEITEMLRTAASDNAFNSQRHFKSHLMEGLVLNVTALASQALSIPSGQYVVWTTDAGHTMLVPTNDSPKPTELFEEPDTYEVYTPDLLGCWNQVERVISEGTA